MDELRQTLEIWSRLAEQYDEVADYHDRMGRTCSNIALLYFDQDQFEEAIKGFRKALDIWEPMVKSVPRPTIVTSMAITHRRLADIVRDIGHDLGDASRLRKSLDAYDASEKSFRQLLEEDVHNIDAKRACAMCTGAAQAFEFLDRWQEAVPEWDKALELESTIQPMAFRDLVRILRTAPTPTSDGTPRRSSRPTRWSARSPSPPDHWSPEPRSGRRLRPPPGATPSFPAPNSSIRPRPTQPAVEMLRKALSAGDFNIPADAARAARDPDLKLLHDRADFQDFMKQVEKLPDSKSP